MSDVLTKTGPLFEGGPTVEAVRDEDSAWHVPDVCMEPYLAAAGAVTYREMATAAEMLKSPGAARAYRDAARRAAGLPFTEAAPRQGWPSSVAGDFTSVGWVVHCQLLERVVPNARQHEIASAIAGLQTACVACGELNQDLASLCVPCAATVRHVLAQRDAEAAAQKVGGKFTGKTRAQLVAVFLDSQGV